MFARIRYDINAIMDRDPAARSRAEVFFLYPGFHALLYHRVAQWFYKARLKFIARWVSQTGRFFTGIEIHPAAKIGKGLFIDHGAGVVIGETAEIGDNVTLYQGVTLGGTGKESGKRHPTLGDYVVVGASAKVLGSFTVGECSKIGAGAVVLKPVPPCCTVVGNPGVIVRREGARTAQCDLDQVHLPDPMMRRMSLLSERITQLEELVKRITEE